MQSDALDEEITGSAQPTLEARVTVSELRLWQIAKTQRELVAVAKSQATIQADQARSIDEIRGFLKRMVLLEEGREARVSILRMIVERSLSLLERLSGPTELAAIGGILRWIGITVVALAAILYGAQVAGWGWTIGFSGDAGITAPAPSPAPPTEIGPAVAP